MYFFNDTARMVLDSSYAGPVQSTWAAGLAHMQALPSLMTYSLPSFDFNISMPASGLGFLTDPRYTIAQMQWNSMTGQGFGLGANGIFQGFGFGSFPGLTNTNPWGLGNLYGIGPSQSSSSSSNSEEAKKDKEAFKGKYDNLKDFLAKLLAQKEPQLLSDRQLKELNDIITDAGKEKKFEDKYNKLLGFYNSLNEGIKRDFIVNYRLASTFQGIGFPDEDVLVEDSDLENIQKGLKNISKDQANTEQYVDELLQIQPDGTALVSALSAIGAYNNKFKPSGENGLITLLQKACTKASQDQRDTAVSGLQTLCSHLVREAKGIAKNPNLDSTTKANINAAVEEFNKYTGSYKDITKPAMKDAFNKLYVITRIAAAKLAENKVKAEFSEFDENIGSFVMESTEEDLKAEGLESVYKECAAKVSVESDGHQATPAAELTPQEKFDKLVEDKIIKENGQIAVDLVFGEAPNTEKILSGRKVYEAKTKFNSDSNKFETHKFVRLKNGNFVEVKYNNSASIYELVTPAGAITPEKLREMVEAAQDKWEDKNSGVNENLQNGNLAHSSDESFYANLNKQNGADRSYKKINETLNSLSKDNVLEFMNSYLADYFEQDPGEKENYDNGLRLGEGLIERLDDEIDCGRRGKEDRNSTGIHMDAKLNLIKAFLDMVKEKNPDLENTKQFAQIVQIYDTYSTKKYYDDRNTTINHRPRWMKFQTFQHKSSNDSVCADVFKGGFGRLFAWGKHTTNQVTRHPGQYMDNTVLDANMLALLRVINEDDDQGAYREMLNAVNK